MPTPPLPDDLALEAIRAVEEHGSQAAAARAMGVPEKTFGHRYRIGIQRGLGVSPGPRKDAVEVGVTPGQISHGWTKTVGKDGEPSHSFFWKAPQETPEDILERVKGAVEGIEPASPIDAPTSADADLCTIYPIADWHLGMQAWGRETGAPYDADIAARRLTDWIGKCIASSPASKEAVILDVGDMTHADDQTNQTPKSRHILDVDTRHFRTLDLAVDALGAAIEAARTKHEKVTVVILPGNHNPTAYITVLFALAERYRNEPRVTVHKEPGEFWVHRFGSNMIAAHHGDKAKPEQIVLNVMGAARKMWGETEHKFLWTGHLHHLKSADIGHVQWEQLRALASRDAYAVAHGYAARPQMQAITLHRDRGEVQRVKVAA